MMKTMDLLCFENKQAATAIPKPHHLLPHCNQERLYWYRLTRAVLLWYPISHVKARNTHTHTHPFNGPLSGTTQVSRYQKGNTNLDFSEARDSEWQWHQLGHMHVSTSLQTDNHASTPPLSFFTGQMPFLLPNQQRRSTEGKNNNHLTASFPGQSG